MAGCLSAFWLQFFVLETFFTLIIIGLIQLVLASLRRYGLRVEYRKLANYLKYCELNLIRSYHPLKECSMRDTKQENKNSKKSVPQFHKLMEMPVTARLVLGECRMDIEEILKLGQGSML